MLSEEQKYQRIFEISKKFACEDTPEVKQMILDINANVSDEAKRINKDAIIIDTCTFSLEGYSWNLQEAGTTALNCTVLGTKDYPGYAMRNIMDYYSAVRYDDNLMMVYKPEDIVKAKEEGKVGVIIGAQSCDFILHNDIDASVKVFYDAGLRVMQIAYNHRSFAADGCYTGTNAGITNDGRKMIRAMQKYGITVDLSHVGELSTLEAMDMSERPMIFSHSNPKGLFQHARNITDEQAKKCAALGGVIGVTSYPVTLWDGEHFPTIDTMVDCIDYYADLIGIDHIGLGLDTNATIGAYEHRKIIYFSKLIKEREGKDSLAYKSFEAGRGYLGECLEGMMNMANMVNITEHLLKLGYREEDIRKILGLNWLRVFKETW